MNLLQRFGYYLGGLCIGMVLVFFLWKKKGTTFNYGLDARVLNNIRLKKMVYSDVAAFEMTKNKLDETAINHILKQGDVNFSESKTHQKPCAIYTIEGEFKNNNITLTIENCDSIATLTHFRIVR